MIIDSYMDNCVTCEIADNFVLIPCVEMILEHVTTHSKMKVLILVVPTIDEARAKEATLLSHTQMERKIRLHKNSLMASTRQSSC